MARTVSPFKLGLFVLICLALIAGAAFWLKAAFWFQKTRIYVTYFDVSVKGLVQDAPVDYLGVPVGRLYKVRIAPDGRLVEVLMKLRENFRVSKNMCARLHEQGLTGLRYLEIDPAPQDIEQFTPKITFRPKYPYIRSYPSDLDMTEVRLHDLYSKLMAVDLKGLANSWKKTAELLNTLLIQLGAQSPTGGDLRGALTSLRNASQHAEALLETLSTAASRHRIQQGMKDLAATLESARKITYELNRQLSALPPGALRRLSDQFSKTLQSGNAAFSNLGAKVNESAVLLESDLQKLGVLISRLNALVRSIKEEPSRLIFPAKQPEEPFKGR